MRDAPNTVEAAQIKAASTFAALLMTDAKIQTAFTAAMTKSAMDLAKNLQSELKKNSNSDRDTIEKSIKTENDKVNTKIGNFISSCYKSWGLESDFTLSQLSDALQKIPLGNLSYWQSIYKVAIKAESKVVADSPLADGDMIALYLDSSGSGAVPQLSIKKIVLTGQLTFLGQKLQWAADDSLFEYEPIVSSTGSVTFFNTVDKKPDGTANPARSLTGTMNFSATAGGTVETIQFVAVEVPVSDQAVKRASAQVPEGKLQKAVEISSLISNITFGLLNLAQIPKAVKEAPNQIEALKKSLTELSEKTKNIWEKVKSKVVTQKDLDEVTGNEEGGGGPNESEYVNTDFAPEALSPEDLNELEALQKEVRVQADTEEPNPGEGPNPDERPMPGEEENVFQELNGLEGEL